MKSQFRAGVAAAALALILAGCTNKVAVAPPPPPPAAPRATPDSPSRTATPQVPARTNVATSPSRMPDAVTRARIQDLLNRIQDAYFDYDKPDLRPDAETALRKDAEALAEIIRQYPDFRLTVEGHCDERGSEEYNLGLGDARARRAKEYLAALGLPGDQLRTVSYGKERPVCTEHKESCWQRNRRAHMAQN